MCCQLLLYLTNDGALPWGIELEGDLLGEFFSLWVEAEKHYRLSPRRILLGYNLAVVAFLLVVDIFILATIISALSGGLESFGAWLGGDSYIRHRAATDGAEGVSHVDLF